MPCPQPGNRRTRSGPGGEFDFFESGRPATHSLPTWVGPGVLLLAFLLTVVNFVGMLGAELHEPVIRSYWSWITTGDLNVAAAIQLDQLSVIMMMIITGVGFLIHVFSVGYMQDDPGYPRYFAYLNLFIFFMLVLVMGASYPIMFIGWEGVGLCSYLLIGFWFSDEAKASAGKKAFIVNRIGDLGFLLAIFLLYLVFQRVDYAGIFGDAESVFEYGGPVITTVTLFFLLAAAGKSAQIPLYVWLPDAMAGPTPVSALIHAATMVTAGIYLVARSSVLFALAPLSSAVVAGIGVLTALFAATIALKQQDIKKVLAYSTVSQLGYMFLGVGVGAYTAGIFHLMTHAFFKALLFLGAGAVIHSMHHAFHHTNKDWDAQDMRNMGGLRAYMPITWIAMWLATLAIAGIWPFAGFFSKDEIIWMTGAMAGAENAPYPSLYLVYWILALATAQLTAFYMTRLMVMTFHGGNRTGSKEAEHLHEAPRTMLDSSRDFSGAVRLWRMDQRNDGYQGVHPRGLRLFSDGRVAPPLARARHRSRSPGTGEPPRPARPGRTARGWRGGVGAHLDRRGSGRGLGDGTAPREKESAGGAGGCGADGPVPDSVQQVVRGRVLSPVGGRSHPDHLSCPVAGRGCHDHRRDRQFGR